MFILHDENETYASQVELDSAYKSQTFMSNSKHKVKKETAVEHIARTHRVSEQEVHHTILDFFSSLDCPRALACWMLFKYKEHDQLIQLKFSHLDYDNPDLMDLSFSAHSFLSKYKGLVLSSDKKATAISQFKLMESKCAASNHRLRLKLDLPLNMLGYIEHTKREIESILGGFTAEEFVYSCNWGPGATTLMKSSDASATNKFHVERGITPRAMSFCKEWFHLAYPSWANQIAASGGFQEQLGNTLITVDKNAKTDRVICIEPGINLWFQKGVGSLLRRRLLKAGINLNKQELNQEKAKEGSKDNFLATLDFRAASDTISIEAVEELLPSRWLDIMHQLRSHQGTMDQGGSYIHWNKFSSMGNGFTFELESLIFYAIARVSVLSMGGKVDLIGVYGDDIILPNYSVRLFTSICNYFGFEINLEKSFEDGLFRESCGAYYLNGCDVKPIYLKEVPSNVEALYKLANAVRRLSHRRCSNLRCDIRFKHCWLSIYLRCPKSVRFQISEGFGDIGFIDNFDITTPSVSRVKDGWEGFSVPALIQLAKTRVHDGSGLLLDRLNTRSLEISYGNYVPVKNRTAMRVKRVLIHEWYNLGCWS